jgi:LPXTG-motif cell wall-anchored protein
MDEISPESLSSIEKRYNTARIIYLGQIVATVILIMVGYFTVKNTETGTDSNTLTILWIVVLFAALGAFLLRRTLYRWERFKNLNLTKGVSGVLSALLTNTIVLGALAEIIVVVGFVIAMMNGNRADLIRAGAVSLIVFLVNLPRKSVWEKIVRSVEKV